MSSANYHCDFSDISDDELVSATQLQCDSSYGFSVTVTITHTVTGMIEEANHDQQ